MKNIYYYYFFIKKFTIFYSALLKVVKHLKARYDRNLLFLFIMKSSKSIPFSKINYLWKIYVYVSIAVHDKRSYLIKNKKITNEILKILTIFFNIYFRNFNNL